MEVAVVAMPDPAMGERACAYVVPAPGATPKLGTLTALLRGSGLAGASPLAQAPPNLAT